ncbi:molybdopterin-guanine dinucleotide biosynthesis protein B [Bacillus sp. 7884-1]|uniref:molybdopterin-guanine dinucleotide biosynthesis protein B n=1 Tax=Bacillus sp. 7884-1 TaxID=2021693 RepID=UPI000BA63CB6|nr:molybdopterin-guanine dinucleotide biosynthesis protein B [Bacillus sp. 7884-1]PAE39367.1 molybdopterin-guanine dinucleotide biosynthesis protein B [Bacillus sp. 7884-1]
MALVKPIIFQVVGYQNSGKTTFILKLIELLKNEGIKSVTIKHHGHGGRPDVIPQKDSSRHLKAGALAALVEGDGRLVLQVDESFLTLDEQIRFMDFFQPDIILIEGHKKQAYPKLLILRNENDLSLITYVTNIKAVLVWNQALIEVVREHLAVPVFYILEDISVTEISKELRILVHNVEESGK